MNDDHGHALLTDFGRSKKIGASGYATCLMAGSTAHMAPELFPLEELEFEEMDKLFSKETDVYSLAMVFFEVLTGEAPFGRPPKPDWQLVPMITKGKRPQYNAQIKQQVHGNIWSIMERCWLHEPADRPTAADVEAWLAKYEKRGQ
ncbi:hypothetical protein HWV62_13433 [Athelia sp. TMB]|nr:hypothetical protein HWV62_13433 [Athelia sp. TMB]